MCANEPAGIRDRAEVSIAEVGAVLPYTRHVERGSMRATKRSKINVNNTSDATPTRHDLVATTRGISQKVTDVVEIKCDAFVLQARSAAVPASQHVIPHTRRIPQAQIRAAVISAALAIRQG